VNDEWLNEIKARNLDGTLLTVLDLVEPFAPLAAGMLWMLQPAAGWFGGRHLMGNLANALEDPAELTRIRKALEKSSNSP
jgi:hypothetical protein